MTRLAMKHEAINMAQGFPDFGTNEVVTEAAVRAIRDGLNQYTVTWGYPPLRQKLAELYTQRLGWQVDPDVHVTVTCGVSEAIMSAVMAVLNPGDEIIILEPAHENFRPAIMLANGVPVSVPLDEKSYRIDPDRIAAAITPKTKAILLNTPHNPTGRVFSQAELEPVIELVLEHDLVVMTDEIYDQILYDGRSHLHPGSLEAIRDRTITMSGLGKSYAITGWRLGHVIAPTQLAKAVRPVHDFMTICAATPLQAAAVAALELPSSYYDQMRQDYEQRRTLMMQILATADLPATPPEGAYYVMTDYSQLDIPQAQLTSIPFAQWMTTEVGVAVVPGESFYSLPGYGTHSIRFAFCKKLETLAAAAQRMKTKFG
jgi:aminotransferase